MRIFGYDSPLARVLNRVTDLVLLNLVTLLLCVPVVTAGASLTALHGTCMQMVRDEEGHVVSDFFRRFKRDFKQATLTGILLLCAVVLLFADLVIFARHGGGLFTVQESIPSGAATQVKDSTVFRVLTVLVLAVLFVIWMTAQYVFPLTARYENGLRDTLKNALLIAVSSFPRTLAMLFIDAFCVFWLITPFAFYVLPVWLLIGISGPAFLKAKLYRPVFEKLEERMT